MPSPCSRGGGNQTHVRAYEAHLEKVLADMSDFGVAPKRRRIEILHA